MKAVGVAVVVIAVAIVFPSCSNDHVVQGGFWFDHVTFDLPLADAERIGGAIRSDEARRIESIARAELDMAYAALRIRFSSNAAGFYRVSVVQDFPAAGLPSAGQSHRLLPFGGVGSVSFRTLADHAIAYAPAGADRAAIIEGIGKGIGRTAAHEFAHQVLPRVNIHASKDTDSYEYGSSDRPSQYYGTLHWEFARPRLEETLGRSSDFHDKRILHVVPQLAPDALGLQVLIDRFDAILPPDAARLVAAER
jgi:hypothetical protein